MMHHQETSERQLTEMYQQWLTAEGLPQLSADELLYEDLTERQRRWVISFYNMWQANDPCIVENIDD